MKVILKVSILVFICLFLGEILFSQDPGDCDDMTESTESEAIITIDHDFSDWENVNLFAGFSSFYHPSTFTLEKNGTQQVLPLSEARYWGYCGTQLKQVKAFMDNTSLFFNFTTHSPVAKGLIIFLYLYQTRNTERLNTYTMEIAMDVDTGKGKVFLWEADRQQVLVIGDAAVTPWNIECKISIDLFPKLLATQFNNCYSADLTTCFFQKQTGTYEEFYFTTIYFKDIPARE